ncbi:hypothetical protein BC455_09960 [Vibrio harveyi]|nr:hypothetical protein BC455_09960 [Vibrio harveyi]
MTRNITERATPRHSDEPGRDQESNCHTLSLNISRKATALGEQILNHARPSLFRMTRNITERTTPRHSDEPKRDQESNCHTLSLNISRKATALGEQILNHTRPSLFRMTRNITERATPRHSDEPKRDQESNCRTLPLNISRKATALGEQILNHTRPSLFRMTRNITERATPRHSDEPKRDQESNGHTLSLNISRKATALGEQIMNHARPSLFRMTRNITERATPRHSDEPRRDQESNCRTLWLNISHQATALGEQIMNHARPSLFRMT